MFTKISVIGLALLMVILLVNLTYAVEPVKGTISTTTGSGTLGNWQRPTLVSPEQMEAIKPITRNPTSTPEPVVNKNPDVTGDGVVDIKDLAQIASHMGKDITALKGLDLNGDGKISTADTVMAQRLLIGVLRNFGKDINVIASYDVSGDGKIGKEDLALIAANFGKPVSEENAKYDLNKDGKINIFDLVRVAKNYGTDINRLRSYDLNSDGKINIFDVAKASKILGGIGKNMGTDLTVIEKCDLNNDGKINIFDLTIAAKSFGFGERPLRTLRGLPR